MFEYVVKIQPLRGEGQDRVAVFARDDGGIVIALADGAGGTSNGAIAAQAVVDVVRGASGDWCELLRSLDRDVARLRGGQTTAVVLEITASTIRGASVGDSEAWLVFGDGRVGVLTEQQRRKPLVGAGGDPVEIEASLGEATLVVASDGLFRFADRGAIARIVAGSDLQHVAGELMELAAKTRYDDVTIVMCRRI